MFAALVFGLLVAFVNGQLKGRIAENAKRKLGNEMQMLLSEAKNFEEVKDSTGEMLYSVGKDVNGQVAGYAIRATGGGFADKIGLLVTLDSKGKNLLGIAVLQSNETPGFGDKIKGEMFKGQFVGCPAGQKLVVIKTGDRGVVDEQIVAITGATISSEAVVKIVNEAVETLRRQIEKSKIKY